MIFSGKIAVVILEAMKIVPFTYYLKMTYGCCSTSITEASTLVPLLSPQ